MYLNKIILGMAQSDKRYGLSFNKDISDIHKVISDFEIKNIDTSPKYKNSHNIISKFVTKDEYKIFSINDCVFNNALTRLTGFVAREVLKSDQIDIKVRKTGVNIDPAKLPDLTNPEILNSHPYLDL